MRQNVLLRDDGEISALKITLEAAVACLLDLEQREISAFGLRPDPVESTKGLESGYIKSREKVLDLAKRLGWNEDMGSLEGPSSRWVDTEKYPTWSGEGARTEINSNDHIERALRERVSLFKKRLRSRPKADQV